MLYFINFHLRVFFFWGWFREYFIFLRVLLLNSNWMNEWNFNFCVSISLTSQTPDENPIDFIKKLPPPLTPAKTPIPEIIQVSYDCNILLVWYQRTLVNQKHWIDGTVVYAHFVSFGCSHKVNWAFISKFIKKIFCTYNRNGCIWFKNHHKVKKECNSREL